MKRKKKKPSIRSVIVEVLKKSSEPLSRTQINSYVTRRLGLFSIKPHTMVSALSILRTSGKIKKKIIDRSSYYYVD